MTEPKKYKLTRIEPLSANVCVDTGETSYQAVEFEPSSNKKYIVSVEVGDVSPREVAIHLQQVRRTINHLFPDGVLIIPARNGHPVMGIYEITPES